MEKQDIEQSQKAYIAQFDPTSPQYHGGSSTPVPMGGNRVPQSMPQEHPQNFNPGEVGPSSEQLGSQYLRIQKERNIMSNLKKLLDKISPFTEAIFRHQETYKTKADKTNEKHLQLHKADVAREEKQIENLQIQILETTQRLIESNKEYQEIKKKIEVVLKESHIHFETKEELTDFGFKVKRLTSQIFSETKKQMDVMKKIKKSYKPPPKVQSVQPKQAEKSIQNPQ